MSTTVSSLLVTQLLASYPHVANCPLCRDYASDYLVDYPPMTVLIAVLDHHDSAHANDQLGRTAALF